MKIVAASDLHGHLPEIPPCDLLLIAGDVCPAWDHRPVYQQYWLDKVFHKWLSHVEARQIVMTWGNHDCIAEEHPNALPQFHSRCQVLVDELLEWEGLRIYGLPWQLRFNDWAFNLDEPELSAKYQAIPECDVIVSHGPPLGYGDRCPDGRRVGSAAFLEKIHEVQPKLAVYGHIHTQPGQWRVGESLLVNASYLNDSYRPQQLPVELSLGVAHAIEVETGSPCLVTA